jgi:D-cysteine desulfhydrase family pyridoxal phosphate-dependent enzyme
MALDTLPRFRLARLPTPLHEAWRLRAALGGPVRCPRILIKRDDLTDLALGGNKARKLEFILADALDKGASALVTTGGVQSNHARMTAAAATLAGLKSILVLSGAAPGVATGNLLLDDLLGAEVHLLDVPFDRPEELDAAEAVKLAEVVRQLEGRGEMPYVVPLGGSNALGSLGYVQATRELLDQVTAAGHTPTHLFYASGSRGTQAGLELGARLFKAPWQLQGIAVSAGESEKRLRAARIMTEAASLVGLSLDVNPDELRTDQSYYGDGYAMPTEGGTEAIRMLARTEAIFLDPVYTAKGMSGLIDYIRRGEVEPRATVIFLHTGGVPGLFAAPSSPI